MNLQHPSVWWMKFFCSLFGRSWIWSLFALAHLILLSLRCFLVFDILFYCFQRGTANGRYKIAVCPERRHFSFWDGEIPVLKFWTYSLWTILQLCGFQTEDLLPAAYEHGLAWSPFPECLQKDLQHTLWAAPSAGHLHRSLILFVYIWDTILHGIYRNRRHYCLILYVVFMFVWYNIFIN